MIFRANQAPLSLGVMLLSTNNPYLIHLNLNPAVSATDLAR